MRRLAEGAAELAAEVRGREPRGACKRRNVEWLAIAGVDQVLGAKKMAGERDRCEHRPHHGATATPPHSSGSTSRTVSVSSQR